MKSCWQAGWKADETICVSDKIQGLDSRWLYGATDRHIRHTRGDQQTDCGTTRSSLLAKLTVPRLPTKFPTFYETRRFITVFTTAHHSLCSLRNTSPHKPTLHLELPLQYYHHHHHHHLCTATTFLTGFRTKILNGFLFKPCILHASPISPYFIWSSE